eukprot:2242455-Alexandrium_andersonii.AAC.1
MGHKRPSAKAAPAASASNAPVPGWRARTARPDSLSTASGPTDQAMAAAPPWSPGAAAPGPSKVTMRPGDEAGPSKT